MRLLLRVVAILAGVGWVWLCWRAYSSPESMAAGDWRTAAFVVTFAAASFGWPARPPKKGSRYKERL